MNELKPCPFCGGTKICTEKGINLIYCDNCSAESNVEHWNTRPIEDALTARIAELEAENYHLQFWLVSAEGEIDQLTAHSDIERQDDKSPNDTQKDETVYRKDKTPGIDWDKVPPVINPDELKLFKQSFDDD